MRLTAVLASALVRPALVLTAKVPGAYGGGGDGDGGGGEGDGGGGEGGGGGGEGGGGGGEGGGRARHNGAPLYGHELHAGAESRMLPAG